MTVDILILDKYIEVYSAENISIRKAFEIHKELIYEGCGLDFLIREHEE